MKKNDRNVLKKLLDDARHCTLRGAEAVSDFLTADKNIHLCFAKITGNPIYFSILKTIHENIRRYYDEFLIMEEPQMNENFRDLEDVVAAMVRGEPQKAADIARAHVRRFNGYMEVQQRRNKV
jgi:GntR family transcriptional regulator, transcriptional repressor for pyruvate dehydrogenase complex